MTDARQPLIDLSAFDEDEPPQRTNAMGDLLSLDPVRIKKLQEKGHDVLVSRVRFEKWTQDRGKVRVPGEYPPELINADWVLAKWGPGLYELKAVNAQGMYLGSSRANIAPAPEPPNGHVNGHTAPVPNGQGQASQSMSSEAFMQQLVLASFARPQPASAEPEPMRQVVGSIAQLMALQMQTQSMAPKTDPVLLELLRELKAQRSAPAKSGPSFAEVMPILQLGLGIGARMTGGAGAGALMNPEEPAGWLKMVPQLADTVGVPLVLSIAQALLPPDKAKGLLEAVEKHMQARTAEAAAVVADAENPETEEP